MTTDRELLELAAKAAGYDTSHPMNAERQMLCPHVDALWVSDSGGLVHTGWNPLTDEAASLRLAVRLAMSVEVCGLEEATYAYAGSSPRVYAMELWRDSPYAATRRAIVRAAAAIGEKP